MIKMIMRYSLLFFLMAAVSDSSDLPNFVLVLTDDQDVMLNGLTPMTKTLTLIANQGATFKNAFVNSPICCPSRSTILTGKFVHNLHVKNNSISGNCSSREWQQNHEGDSFVNVLKKRKSYQTFYAGKYLNQYGNREAGGMEHVPEGYDWWLGLKGNSKYYNYSLSINGTEKIFTNEYLTDVIKNYALDFLNGQNVKNAPFFMFLAPPAAHAPFTPAPRHTKYFPDVKALRTPSFNYTPTNKHWLLQIPPLHLPEDVTILDNIQKQRFQTLLAVDEMIEAIHDRLSSMQILNNTYIIFTSDNGFHIGQFGQPWDKRQPYETDVRVPFLIRGPNVPKKVFIPYPISAVDIAPTILDIAGIENAYMDGSSFKESLEQECDYDRFIFTQYFGEGDARSVDSECSWDDKNDLAECAVSNWCKCQDARNNTYTCLRHITPDIDIKMCDFADNKNFTEVYDLKKDKYELNNLSAASYKMLEVYKQFFQKMSTCQGNSCKNFN